ncbi:MAG: hypothetical protein HRU10_15295 [Opitutales bacterium]|nr:hypothetical protein [Opitutales bacterium]
MKIALPSQLIHSRDAYAYGFRIPIKGPFRVCSKIKHFIAGCHIFATMRLERFRELRMHWDDRVLFILGSR